MYTCYMWIFAFIQKHRQLILWIFSLVHKPVDMWLLKAVYLYSVYLKFCKRKVETVCVLKFTVYNVKDFIYYRKYKTSKTFCVWFILVLNTCIAEILHFLASWTLEMEHCKVYLTSSTNPIEISMGRCCHCRNDYLI